MRLDEKSRSKSECHKPQSVDIHVGMRIRQRRTSLGISENQLSAAIGVTCEQMQQYECGAAHIPALCLYDVAAALNAPIHFFFEDVTEPVAPDFSPPPPRQVIEFDTIEECFGENGMLAKETLQFVRTCYHIKPSVRVEVFKLLSSLAAEI